MDGNVNIMQNDGVKEVTTRIIVPHVYLYHAALNTLKQAEESNDDLQFYNCMGCILFSALCLEAYLNYIGQRAFRLWSDDLECLNPMAKLRLIAQERTNALPDFSKRPFQSFSEIFKFRNLLAHGKIERLKKESSVNDVTSPPKQPIGKWERYCTIEKAKKLFEDTELMIRTIQMHTPDKSDPFEKFGVSATNYYYDSDPDDLPPMPEPEHFL